ncbi:MAG TPA: hypothetical protein VJ373_05890 [Desulfatiglandales bacterium]|nr:hypothetical protein [Desulfatiglandales bacterium]
MKVEKDYEELLELFNRHNVRYCIVGSFALAFYARPRYTKDLDILIEPTIENARKVLDALNDFGFGSLALSEDDFTEKGRIIQLGYEPVRIDIITSLEGMDFNEIWDNRSHGQFGKEQVFFIGLNEFIKVKQAANRSQDRADLEVLLEIDKNKDK